DHICIHYSVIIELILSFPTRRSSDLKEKVIIVGGGPCGLACSLALQKHGMDSLVIEKGNIVQTIYNFPTHQRFFSSSERLEIGGIPFITEKQKPVRNEALAYYRSVRS